MRKSVLIGAALVALAGGGYFGWEWWTVGRFFESTDNAYVHSDISIISPKIAGYVADIRVGENQEVAAGDVLVVIDDSEYRAQQAQSDAALEAAQAAIGSIDSRITLEHSMIAQAQATVAGSDADLHRARQDFDRVKSLVSGDTVSRQRFDTAEADLRKAEAALDKAKAALAAEHDQLGVLQASRKEAEAKVRQAAASLDLARDNLSHTIIRSPVDGVIGNKGVQLGQYVKAGTAMLAVVPLPDVYVVANFKETQLAGMRRGQSVTLSVDAFPGHTLRGTVDSFAPASGAQFSLLPPENATGNFTKVVQRIPVRIAVPTDNPLAGLLRPGLSVEAAVDTREEGIGPLAAGGIFGTAAAAEPGRK
ncbi:multidrug transporter [Skermanella stibiiresistens SB22]|uniref:Multidrug transporter n=1 Tax=Skermanella stibiiresistens SB22 TaxID=1385369 RepID=W9H234_9PROT|nr:HlyD family secretion protein [Skermanella stibiiresistens]EWY40240.1 multidrug transporter [Skermanella stibiiresistens SB22]